METENLQSKTAVKAGLMVGVSFVLGLLFNYFFIEKIPGISFPLYVMAIVVGLFGLASFLKKQLNKNMLWLLVPLIFFSLMVAVRASDLLIFLNVVASILLLLLITELMVGEKLKNFLIGDYLKICFLPFKFIHPLLQTIANLFPRGEMNKEQRVSSQVLRGILMALPVLFLFLILFSSADLIFHKYLADLITLDLEEETVARALVVLITTLIFTGAYTYSFREKENALTQSENSPGQRVGHIESAILLGSVNALFFIFILVQLTYLFAGESAISAQGFTYADYARRGFFELIAVAIVSLLLLLSTEKYVVKKITDHALSFKILSTALVVQVILIMTSAFTRLSLYETAYGFTTLRLYSHAFIILLAVIFCLLLYKIYQDKREHTFAFRVFIALALFLAVMNGLNPDAFIARQNLERLATTGKLDVYYLSRLSSDALPETIKILNISDEDLRQSFARDLYWRARNGDARYQEKWQSFNLSRLRADKILKSNLPELETHKDYQQQSLPFSQSI